MTKIFISLLLAAAGFSAGATELTPEVKELNAAVENLIAPLRNETTTARLEFTDVRVNEQRALGLAFNGQFKKIGPVNTFEIRLDNVSYDYGDGTAPTTRIKGFVGSDLTKIFTQEQLNKMIPELENFVASIAAGYVSRYGEAATVKFEVLDRIKDDAGNFTAINAQLYVNIDVSKLPADQKSEDVMVQTVSANLSADVKSGLLVDLTIVSNPAYRAFHGDELGLKEALQKLLTKNEQELRDIQKFFLDLDQFAARIVNGHGL